MLFLVFRYIIINIFNPPTYQFIVKQGVSEVCNIEILKQFRFIFFHNSLIFSTMKLIIASNETSTEFKFDLELLYREMFKRMCLIISRSPLLATTNICHQKTRQFHDRSPRRNQSSWSINSHNFPRLHRINWIFDSIQKVHFFSIIL